jgi:hypothetical protein
MSKFQKKKENNLLTPSSFTSVFLLVRFFLRVSEILLFVSSARAAVALVPLGIPLSRSYRHGAE